MNYSSQNTCRYQAAVKQETDNGLKGTYILSFLFQKGGNKK